MAATGLDATKLRRSDRVVSNPPWRMLLTPRAEVLANGDPRGAPTGPPVGPDPQRPVGATSRPIRSSSPSRRCGAWSTPSPSRSPPSRVACVDLAPRGATTTMPDGRGRAARRQRRGPGRLPQRPPLRAPPRAPPPRGHARRAAAVATRSPCTSGARSTASCSKRSRCPCRAPGEVVVEVRATGLNFRDVLNVLGMYPGAAGDRERVQRRRHRGRATTSTSVAVGDEVDRPRRAGPSVATPPRRPTSSSRSRAGLDFAAGASTPIAFLTAQLRPPRAGRASAPVTSCWCTPPPAASAWPPSRSPSAPVPPSSAPPASDEKRSLLRSIGVEHVFDSRSLTFAPAGHSRSPGGRGVDIALNSLADDFIGATIDVVAEHGTFLEIGKRGIWSAEAGRGVLPHRPLPRLRPHRRRSSVNPALLRSMMADVLGALTANELQPLPHRCFPIEDVRVAFRHMAMARHVGKVVVTQGRRVVGGRHPRRSLARW